MSELIALEQLNPLSVFVNNGLDEIIDKIEADVKSIATDPTTKKGREEIASLAYKIARSKTTLDEMGKSLTEEWKKKSAAVDAERKRMRDRMDQIKDEVRKPLTDFEKAEENRVQTLRNRLSAIELLKSAGGDTQEELRIRLAAAEAIDLSDWQEFADFATVAKKNTVDFLTAELEKRIKYDADQAELARLREEAQKREQEERDAKIAAEAAEKARQDAEQKAEAERQRIMKEKEDAERAAAHAAEQARLAEQRANEAAQAERDRQEEEKRQEAAAATARATDAANRTKVNNEILADLAQVEGLIDPEVAKNLIRAIVRGQIRHVTITY